MDEINADEMIVEWKTPNSSEFGSLESSCVKRLDFELTTATDEIINGIESLGLSTAAVVAVTGDSGVTAAKCTNGNADGNDSGVDTGATTLNGNPPIQLQRALSNNSAGYASSSGGHDAQFASCNSSLLSVCSDSHDGKLTVMSCDKGSNIDCTSENGSESSSVSGGDKHGRMHRQTPPKKRVVGVNDPNQLSKLSPRSCDSSVSGASSCGGAGSNSKARLRATSANRALNSSRNFCAPSLATTERARSRDKQITPNSQSSPTKQRTKPTTLLTNNKLDLTPAKTTASTLRRAASVTRRTPTGCTPSTEDGRWPSIQLRSTSRTPNRTTTAATTAAVTVSANESLIIKTKIGPIVLDHNSKPGDRFSTMPRRQKKVKSQEDLSEWRSSNRSSSTTRDRMSMSTSIVRRSSTREPPNKSSATAAAPRYQKTTAKTLIYHEAAIQTAITSQDIDDAFAGNPKAIQIDAIAKVDRNCQVDIRDRDIERLEEQIKMMSAENKILRQNLVERSQLLTTMEQQIQRERDEKEAMKKELQSNTERVLGMLELVHVAPATPTSTTSTETTDGGAAGACDSLLMLESQIQLSGHALEQKQTEINTLRKFCNQLQAEMKRSQQVQQSLLEEKKTFEKETTELQDFLQDEKTAIFEALKDAETELEECQAKLKGKEQEADRLQDECRHLVRISEQRR